MQREVFELVLKTIADAMKEQYVQPMTHALCLLTYAVAHRKDGEWLERELRHQAETCPEDIAGKGILFLLAEMAGLPDSAPPDAVRTKANTSLTLIQGGRKD